MRSSYTKVTSQWVLERGPSIVERRAERQAQALIDLTNDFQAWYNGRWYRWKKITYDQALTMLEQRQVDFGWRCEYNDVMYDAYDFERELKKLIAAALHTYPSTTHLVNTRLMAWIRKEETRERI